VHGIRFVDGVELTALWRGREIHVVGLNIDPARPQLRAHVHDLTERRRQRLRAIGVRLARAGIAGEALAAAILEAAPVATRTHLARALVEQGLAKDVQQAFERWLGHGRPGHVPAHWPELQATVECIGAAGGIAVLAHPHRYRTSAGVLGELCAEFKAAGGGGIEVSLAGMGPSDAARAAGLARRFDLAGSIGSDFHEPGLPWRPLGRFAKLPDGVAPVTARLGWP
jgi:hypothetical protein